MHLRSFRLTSYKCFDEPLEIALNSGFNVIVGQNNVGKTALAQAIGGPVNNPHRSSTTVRHRDAIATGPTRQEYEIHLPKSVLFGLWRDYHQSVRIHSPFADLGPNEAYPAFLNHIDSVDSFPLQITYEGGGLKIIRLFGSSLVDPASATYGPVMTFNVRDDGGLIPTNREFNTTRGTELFNWWIVQHFTQRCYTFLAERPNIGVGQMHPNEVLQPSGANLAQVLHYLRNKNEAAFERYRQAVRRVLPQIKQITTVPIDTQNCQIYIWHVDPSTERDDLAVTLPESGTGVGQVLAMLYVVLTSRMPRVIVIDEPQSYLHPGAIRALFEVMQSYPQHQYIITTHSPTAVTAANPQTLHLVKRDGEKSVIESLDAKEVTDLRRYLSDIGARLSDVFGYDRILWVEGPTEERAFPAIAKRLLRLPLSDTAILAVKSTGDFERKDAERIWDIYNKLNQGNALLPPALGFIFDREGRPEDERMRFASASKELVTFTGRRMYENYLLNPGAIAALMNGLENFRKTRIAPAEIESWISTHQWDKELFKPMQVPENKDQATWLSDVHGGKVLAALFKEFSDTNYSCLDAKATYGAMLTDWLIDNAPEELKEVADLINAKISSS